MFRKLAIIILVCVLLTIWGCGTLLYPERRGQAKGRIDPAVAIFDGLGCLLFLVPGLIAFAIDFGTGAIYLPPGKADLESDKPGQPSLRVVRVDPSTLNEQTIVDTVKKYTGIAETFSLEQARTYRMDNVEEATKYILSETF
jgi:hypothetical protein